MSTQDRRAKARDLFDKFPDVHTVTYPVVELREQKIVLARTWRDRIRRRTRTVVTYTPTVRQVSIKRGEV